MPADQRPSTQVPVVQKLHLVVGDEVNNDMMMQMGFRDRGRADISVPILESSGR
jgi:hypothetical protein